MGLGPQPWMMSMLAGEEDSEERGESMGLVSHRSTGARAHFREKASVLLTTLLCFPKVLGNSILDTFCSLCFNPAKPQVASQRPRGTESQCQ